MELSSHEEDTPFPLNTRGPYIALPHGLVHGHYHHDPPPPTIQNNNGSSSMERESNHNQKKVVRYKECLKNHAASVGGNATDGCGEFIPNGEEGSIDAFTCSACNCHRNFHRKGIEGEPSSFMDIHNSNYHGVIRSRKFLLNQPHDHNTNANNSNFYLPSPHGHHHHQQPLLGYPTNAIPPRGVMLPSESDEHEEHIGGGGGLGGGVVMGRTMKKRFRTKFTQEQKEKMYQFAEKVGWKLQKQEESVVQQFCQEIGVKRRVLKVWMHNNKQNLTKKNLCSTI